MGDLTRRCFICAGAQEVVIGNNRFAFLPFVLIVESGLALGAGGHRGWSIRENCPVLNSGTAIGDGDVGDANRLYDAGLLTRPQRLDLKRRSGRPRLSLPPPAPPK